MPKASVADRMRYQHQRNGSTLAIERHFKVHVNSKDDQLFISKPVIGRASNKWSVQFTRRFSNQDGSFAGVVVASMDPAHFTSLYNRIELGATTLSHDDRRRWHCAFKRWGRGRTICARR